MWSVYVNGAWQSAENEAQVADWVRRGFVGPQTLVHHATWPNPVPIAQVPSFGAMFLRDALPGIGGPPAVRPALRETGPLWYLGREIGQLLLRLGIAPREVRPLRYLGMGVLALFLVAFLVGMRGVLGFAGHAPYQAHRDRDTAECTRVTNDLANLAKLENENIPIEDIARTQEALRTMERWVRDATEGERVCEQAGMSSQAAGLRDAKQEAQKQLLAARTAVAQARTAPPPTQSTTGSLDPTTCPKGRVLIDANSGKAVDCTGPVTTANNANSDNKTSDAEDVNSKCRDVRNVWTQLDGIDPVIRCDSPRPDHAGIKVLVTNAGWEYLGEHGKANDFTMSFVEAYKIHWKQFHGWEGGDPAHHLVAVWMTTNGGLDEKIVSTANAAGEYAESP